MHELLHHLCYHKYVEYQNLTPGACEEYEIRVLTDLLMFKYMYDTPYEVQGMYEKNNVNQFQAYESWLGKIVGVPNYNIEEFKIGFKMYGYFCIENINSDNNKDNDLITSELNYYQPLLMWDYWFDFE